METAEYEELERKNFKVWNVLLITTIGIAFCGVEIWLIAGQVTLPIAEIIEDAPTLYICLVSNYICCSHWTNNIQTLDFPKA